MSLDGKFNQWHFGVGDYPKMYTIDDDLIDPPPAIEKWLLGRRPNLYIYGPYGSGKTWLGRWAYREGILPTSKQYNQWSGKRWYHDYKKIGKFESDARGGSDAEYEVRNSYAQDFYKFGQRPCMLIPGFDYSDDSQWPRDIAAFHEFVLERLTDEDMITIIIARHLPEEDSPLGGAVLNHCVVVEQSDGER